MKTETVLNKMKPKIMVVDDEENIRRLMGGILTPAGYEVSFAENGIDALVAIERNPPDVILLDVKMPKMNGFEVARCLKADEGTKIIPIVMVSALSEVEDRVKAIEAGTEDFLSKPVDRNELLARVSSLLKVKEYNDYMLNHQKELEVEVIRSTQELSRAFKQIKLVSLDTIYRLSRAAEYRDDDTGEHIHRISYYSTSMARRMNLDEQFVEHILWASPMHDIGKIGIPDHILLKPDKLKPSEWEIMKQHTTMGAEILVDPRTDFVKLARTIALSHHEKWDGSGYPQGIKGSDIPLAARIVALADVFDALTSKRPYKDSFSFEKAMAIIQDGRGSHFDPQIVDSFFSIEDEIYAEFNWWSYLSSDSNSYDTELLTGDTRLIGTSTREESCRR
ncbi:HD domain-containing phosphohydrolase [Chloroflexota bacterium]